MTGIPHAVLIDRSGIVRLVAVGSGPKPAHDLDVKRAELFGDPPLAAQAVKGK